MQQTAAETGHAPQLPTFIVIGAMKCGTTSLHGYLNTHPDVCMSTDKETDFFVAEHNFSRGLDWYRGQFAIPARARGESSPNYTKSHLFAGVADRMYAQLPEARLIYCIREPVARMVSHYVHNFAHGRESQPFEQAVAEPENNYLLTSSYARQLQPFVERYGEDALLLVSAESLRADPLSVMSAIFHHIDVTPGGSAGQFSQQMHTSGRKKRRSPLEIHVENPLLRRLIRPLLPRRLTERRSFDRPQVAAGLRENILGRLAADRQATAALFQRRGVGELPAYLGAPGGAG
ncbi:MAG: sulfotransferase family 2 domain-containing protein [Gammaproteobacteria bacterium]|nr:sulfotransferase family 2 domain-containing protein [Gammaproteobacteria bacterium]